MLFFIVWLIRYGNAMIRWYGNGTYEAWGHSVHFIHIWHLWLMGWPQQFSALWFGNWSGPLWHYPYFTVLPNTCGSFG